MTSDRARTWNDFLSCFGTVSEFCLSTVESHSLHFSAVLRHWREEQAAGYQSKLSLWGFETIILPEKTSKIWFQSTELTAWVIGQRQKSAERKKQLRFCILINLKHSGTLQDRYHVYLVLLHTITPPSVSSVRTDVGADASAASWSETEFNFCRDSSNALYFDPGGLLLSDLIFWSASNRDTLPPEQLHQHRTPPASESARARTSLVAHQKTVCRPAARRETTSGTRAAHQRRLNPDLFLALRLPVNHCCSFQRGEWISSAPGTHRLILNCLADNFYIIAGC